MWEEKCPFSNGSTTHFTHSLTLSEEEEREQWNIVSTSPHCLLISHMFQNRKAYCQTIWNLHV